MSDASSPSEAGLPIRSAQLHGAVAGVIGGAVISLIYLALDVAAGHPFYTPNALGAALFRGESLEPGAPIELPLVLGYTAVHGGVFVGFGLMAGLPLLEGPRHWRNIWVAAGVAAFALFVAFEITFEVFGALFTPGGRLGGTRALFANAVAALAMAAYLAAVRTRSGRSV